MQRKMLLTFVVIALFIQSTVADDLPQFHSLSFEPILKNDDLILQIQDINNQNQFVASVIYQRKTSSLFIANDVNNDLIIQEDEFEIVDAFGTIKNFSTIFINDIGDIACGILELKRTFSMMDSGLKRVESYILRNGKTTLQYYENFHIHSINNHGMIAGDIRSTTYEKCDAAVIIDDKVIVLPALGGENQEKNGLYDAANGATGINDSGVVVGWSVIDPCDEVRKRRVKSGPSRAFMWNDHNQNQLAEKEELLDISTPINSICLSRADGINNSNTVFGSVYAGSDENSFVFQDKNQNFQVDKDEFFFLPVPDELYNSRAMDINNHGVICGRIWDPKNQRDSSRAVIWIGKHMIDLNECKPEGVDKVLHYATRINDNNWIVCGHMDRRFRFTGNGHNVVLIPTKENQNVFSRKKSSL
jgi:hypothetical protein